MNTATQFPTGTVNYSSMKKERMKVAEKKSKPKQSYSFYDNDKNNIQRELVAYYEYSSGQKGNYFSPSYDASVSIYRIELRYKSMRRYDVSKYLSVNDISEMEEKILESL